MLLTALCIVATVKAQTYKGTVKDQNGKPIPFANAVLFILPNSTFIAGAGTNDLGEFIRHIFLRWYRSCRAHTPCICYGR